MIKNAETNSRCNRLNGQVRAREIRTALKTSRFANAQFAVSLRSFAGAFGQFANA